MMWSVTDPDHVDRPTSAAAAAALGSAVDVVGVLVERPGRLVGRVRTTDGEFVVKVDDGRDAFAAEQRAMTRLRAAGLPVGEVVAVHTGPPAVLVARWIPGRGVTAADPPDVLADVGRLLRRVHDLPAGSSYSGRPSISAWIGDWLTIVLGWWGRSDGVGRATGTQVAAARAWFAEVGPALAAAGAGTAILLDGRPQHVIVDDEGVVGLIDVADLDSGDPAMDLAVLELDEPGMCDAVLAGYRPGSDERARLDAVVPFYVFLRALAAAEWRIRIEGDSNVEDLLDRASHELAAWRSGR